MSARPLRWNVGMSPQPFTSREQQVATLILQGQSNRAIATTLGITEQRVKNSLTAIFEKRAVASRLQLALVLQADLR